MRVIYGDFFQRSSQYDRLFRFAPFSRRSMVLEDCQYHLLYWALHLELFLLESQSVSNLWSAFSTQFHSDKSIFSPFVKLFFTKTRFFEHMTHSSANLIWFAHLRRQRFNGRPLLRVGHSIQSWSVRIDSNKIFCEITIILLWTNSKQLWKKFRTKIAFIKHNPLIY